MGRHVQGVPQEGEQVEMKRKKKQAEGNAAKEISLTTRKRRNSTNFSARTRKGRCFTKGTVLKKEKERILSHSNFCSTAGPSD